MARDTIKVADFDVEGLRAEIKKVAPRMISYQDALDTVREPLLEKLKEGAAVEGLAAALKRQGTQVSPRSLKQYLDTGWFSTRVPRKPKQSAAAEGFTAGPLGGSEAPTP